MALWQSLISKKKLILLKDNNLSLYKRFEIENFSKKTKSRIYNLSEDIDFKELCSNILKNDFTKQTNFFLNSSNYKKNFNKVMLDIIDLIIKDN